MPIPDGYFYQSGAYWKNDSTGPYAWNGTTMQLIGLAKTVTLAQAATATELVVPNRFAIFLPDGDGPVSVA